MDKEKEASGVLLSKAKSIPWLILLVFLLLIAVIMVSGFFYYQKQRQVALHEQTALLQAIADAALCRAKAAGRNKVVSSALRVRSEEQERSE